uniref:hypothetical protein n=1 Tax=Burkholderia arboris TaxID=488730 RepID=UPI003BEF1F37
MEHTSPHATVVAPRSYRVHLYAVVQVPIEGLQAPSHIDAIAAAHREFDPTVSLQHAEFADEIVGALVDEEGDTEFMHSTFYIPCLSGPDPWVPEPAPQESGIRITAHQAAIRFFDELLDSVESLGAIAEIHGVSTLANLMYLQHAILTGGKIELNADEHAVVSILDDLPSAKHWLTYVFHI